jgi:hypothetical protein
MLMHCFTGLFRKRCPLCRQEVQAQGDETVQHFGKWFCSKVHADLYECELYEALRTVHCHHAGCHGEHVPLSDAVGLSASVQNPELTRLREARPRCFTPLP